MVNNNFKGLLFMILAALFFTGAIYDNQMRLLSQVKKYYKYKK